MADKPLMTGAKTVEQWVHAYLDEDTQNISKKDKFIHLQKVAQFGAFCFVIEKNSKQAHVDFFETNYTHTDAKIAQAAEFVSRLLQKKYENGGTLSPADFTALNGTYKLFPASMVTDALINDYFGLVEMFDGVIPHDPLIIDNTTVATTEMLQNLNNDMKAVKVDHSKLLHATNAKYSCLERQQIFDVLDTATEKLGGIFKDVKKEKSAAEKELKDQQEKTLGFGIDLGIKTGKVGLVGVGGVGCIGAVVSGMFWPALGLIPLYALAKSWVPDFAKSLGAVYGNFKKVTAAKYKIRKADVKIKYIEKGPDSLTLRERAMLTKGDIVLLTKQVKSFHMFNGADSMKEQTVAALSNLGNLKDHDKVDDLVPADARGVIENAVSNLKSKAPGTVEFSEIYQVAKMLKTLESKLPAGDISVQNIKRDYYEEVRKYYNSVLFDAPYTSQKLQQVKNESEGDSVMAELLKDTGSANVEQALKNSIKFIDSEKKQLPKVDGSGGTIDTLGNYGVSSVALLTSNTDDVEKACETLDGGYTITPALTTVIAKIFSPNSHVDYATIMSEIGTAATGKAATEKYLKHMLELRSSLVSLQSSEISVKTTITINGKSKGVNEWIAGLKMLTSQDGLSNMGKMVTVNGVSLEILRSEIVEQLASNTAERDAALQVLDEQVRRIEAANRFDTREFIMKQIIDGTAGTYSTTMENIAKLTFEKAEDANALFAELKTGIGITKKLDYFTLKIRDQMEQKFMDEARIREKYQDVKPETLDNIVKFMIKVKGAEYFSDGQKVRLFGIMENYLEKALNEKLRLMEKNLLVNVEKSGEIMTELENFITQSYGTGFKEFFDGGSPASINIKNRIERLTTALGNALLLQAGGKNGSPMVVDGNKQDTQIYLSLYFEDSTNRNHVIAELTDLQRISQESSFDALQTNGVDTSDSKCFITMLTNKVNDIDAGLYGPKEKLAMLLMAKKRALAMFKAHLEKYYRAHTSDYTTDMASATGDYSNIKAHWKSLLQLIDSKITALETDPACVTIIKGRHCGNSVTTLDSIGSNTITNYYSSSSAQPGLS